MLKFYDKEFSSRLLTGTALYPSPAIMQQAIRASGAEIVTAAPSRIRFRDNYGITLEVAAS
jgi:thiazole synthase